MHALLVAMGWDSLSVAFSVGLHCGVTHTN
jgi:hypothetical protein